MSKTMNLLRERIERNYEDFKAETITYDKEDIFELAGRISAIEDVLFFLSTHDWLDEDEAGYLLRFDNPLEMMADVWEEYLLDSDSHFRATLDELFDNDEYNEERYTSTALAAELRRKYGNDTPIKEAILCEMVNLGKKLYNIPDYEDDDWGTDID